MAVVVLTTEAKEDLRDLDGAARKIVAKALLKLKEEPEKRGQPLSSQPSGDLTTFRKMVVGNRDYRVIYRIEPDGSVCVVWVIAKRDDAIVYDLAISRLKLYGNRTQLANELSEIIEMAKNLNE